MEHYGNAITLSTEAKDIRIGDTIIRGGKPAKVTVWHIHTSKRVALDTEDSLSGITFFEPTDFVAKVIV